MADLEASRADEVDALDGFVDSLAVQDPPAQFLDSDPKQLAVLALDLSPAGFVLGKVGIFVGLVGHVAEGSVLVALGGLALARSAHRLLPPDLFYFFTGYRVRPTKPQAFSQTR